MTRNRTATITLAAMLALAPIELAAGSQASDDATTATSEEAAAVYFAPPPSEEAEAAIDAEAMDGAGAVAIAMALGRVETALEGCRTLREEVTALIGDAYGSYSVDPGWPRLYQDCVLTRDEEARALGRAIRTRRTTLLERVDLAASPVAEAEAQAARVADLMARLAARQSGVRLAVRRELRLQEAFVRRYNTDGAPDEDLDEGPNEGPDEGPNEGKSAPPDERRPAGAATGPDLASGVPAPPRRD